MDDPSSALLLTAAVQISDRVSKDVQFIDSKVLLPFSATVPAAAVAALPLASFDEARYAPALEYSLFVIGVLLGFAVLSLATPFSLYWCCPCDCERQQHAKPNEPLAGARSLADAGL